MESTTQRQTSLLASSCQTRSLACLSSVMFAKFGNMVPASVSSPRKVLPTSTSARNVARICTRFMLPAMGKLFATQKMRPSASLIANQRWPNGHGRHFQPGKARFCRHTLPSCQYANALIRRQRYSNYLPLNRPSRATSRAASLVKDGTRSPKETSKNGRASSATQAQKRRSTMNSRDAAYDEDEQIRQAIEASKEEAAIEQPEGNRRPKRGRSGSEE